MTTTLHRDGTVTYVLHAYRYRTATLPEPSVMDVLRPPDRRRIALHLASHGDQRAQAWLDEHPRRTGEWASTPNDLRNRPAIRVTLARDVLARLDALALRWGVPRSRAIERLVEESTTKAPRPRRTAGRARKSRSPQARSHPRFARSA